MTDHNGVLTMQRLLLAGALGMTMARKAAAILEGEPGARAHGGPPQPPEGAVLRAILDAANECLGISMSGRRGSGGATRCCTCSTWPPSRPTRAPECRADNAPRRVTRQGG